MAASLSAFPAFIVDEYIPGHGFAEFEGSARATGERVRRQFESDFQQVQQIAARALSMPRTSGGSLDLGIDQYRQQAAAAEASAIAQRELATALDRVAREQGDTSEATRRYITAARAAAIEDEQQATELRQLATALDLVQTELGQTASRTQLVVDSNERLGSSARNSRFAMVQVGQQFQDIAIQLQTNTPLATIFTQQVSQMGFALSTLEKGPLAAVGRFLTGPWGTALFLATSAVSVLANTLFRSKDAHNAAASGAQAHKTAEEQLTAALREANDQAAKAASNAYAQERAELAVARATLARAVATREALRAQLESEVTQRQIDQTRSQAPGQRGEIAALGAPVTDRIIAGLQARIAEQQRAITEAQRGVRIAEIPAVRREIEARGDAAAAATLRLDREEAIIQNRYQQGRATLQEYTRELDRITRAREAAQEATRNQSRAERDAARDARASAREAVRTREQLYREARQRAQAIGAAITSGFRTPEENRAAGGARNSFHLSHRALDLGLNDSSGRRLTKDRIREAFQGFNITELLGPGDPGHADHFHVAWSGAMEGVGDSADQLSEDLRRLLDSFNDLTRQFDPAASAASDYAGVLARIADLQQAGIIDAPTAMRWQGEAFRGYFENLQRIEQETRRRNLENLSPAFQDQVSNLGEIATDTLVSAGRAGGDAFRTSGVDAAYSIADAFGGRMRGVVGDIIGLLGGSAAGLRGPLGGIVGLLSGPGQNFRIPLPFGGSVENETLRSFNPLQYGLLQVFDRLRGGLDGVVDALQRAFSRNGDLSRMLGEALGYGAIGAAAGGLVGGNRTLGAIGGILGGEAGKALGSTLGKGLGGALGFLGNAAGPLGSILGGVAGSLLGGLLSSTPRASSTITAGGGNLAVSGTTGTRSLRGQTVTAADSVISTVQRIAEMFGGSVISGAGSVSIGIRDGNYRVDPSGRGITKTKKGAIDFGEDAEAAIRAAVLDLIKDGVIAGLRAGTQRLLQQGKDLDAAIDKALKFESVFIRLKEKLDPVGAALDALDKEFAGLRQIFKEAGASAAELAQLEQLYALEREEAIKQAGERMTSALKSLLDDLTVNNEALSLRERLSQARARYDPLAARVAAGDQSVDFDEFADAARLVNDLTRQIYGSTDTYFEVLRQMTELSQMALDRQQAIIDAATGGAGGDTNAPVVSAVDRLGDTLLGGLGGQLEAVNDNLGTLIRQFATLDLGGGGGRTNKLYGF